MKTLGLDLGAKRIGVAVSDESGRIALPTATLAGDQPNCEIVADLLNLADQPERRGRACCSEGCPVRPCSGCRDQSSGHHLG